MDLLRTRKRTGNQGYLESDNPLISLPLNRAPLGKAYAQKESEVKLGRNIAIDLEAFLVEIT